MKNISRMTIYVLAGMLVANAGQANMQQFCGHHEDNLQKIALRDRYPTNANESRFPRVYFLLPRKLAGESFRAVERNLPELKELGIEQVWISNLNEQTTRDFFGSYNDHGYWPASHSIERIDPALGGKQGLEALIKRMRAENMNLMPDAVINHLGYGQEFILQFRTETGEVKTLKVRDTDNIFQPREKGDAPDEIMFRPEHETTQAGVIDAINKASEYNLAGLPTFNPHSPLVQDYIYHSYRERIDLGMDTIRIDAGKHKPVWFTELLVKRLNEYAQKKYNKKIKIVAEFLYHKHFVLDSILDYMHEKVPGAEFYLFDYPLANELRSTAKSEYSFEYLQGYLRHREREGLRQHNRLVPMMEDHDFLSPIRSYIEHLNDPFVREMVYSLSEFISQNPTVLYHGSEKAEAAKDHRPEIAMVKGQGKVGQALRRISQAMDKSRNWPENAITDVHHASKDVFIASKPATGGRVFIFINRSNQPVNQVIDVYGVSRSAKLENVHLNGKSMCWNQEGKIHFTSQGPSIDVFFAKDFTEAI